MYFQLLLVIAALGLATARPESQGYGSQPAGGYGVPAPDASKQEPSVATAYGGPGEEPAGAASGQEGNVAGPPAEYNFEYAVEDEETGNNFGQEEVRDGDVTTGSYFVQMPDGRMQIVNYSVDGDSGYVVDIEVSRYSGSVVI